MLQGARPSIRPENDKESVDALYALIDECLNLNFSLPDKDKRVRMLDTIIKEAEITQSQSVVYTLLMNRTQVRRADPVRQKNAWRLLGDISTRLQCPDVAHPILASDLL